MKWQEDLQEYSSIKAKKLKKFKKAKKNLEKKSDLWILTNCNLRTWEAFRQEKMAETQEEQPAHGILTFPISHLLLCTASKSNSLHSKHWREQTGLKLIPKEKSLFYLSGGSLENSTKKACLYSSSLKLTQG